MGAARVLTLRLLETAAGVDTPVSVTSSNSAIVAVAAGAVVRAGQQIVDLQITTGTAGTVTLTIEAAGIRRELTIVVGLDPTPGGTLQSPRRRLASVVPNPSIGRVFGSPGAATAATLTLPLLDAPAASATIATVTSGNIAVVTVGGGATTTVAIGTGERVLHLPIAISGTGAALLTIEVNGQRRELVVIVGNPPASQIPAVTAPIVGTNRSITEDMSMTTWIAQTMRGRRAAMLLFVAAGMLLAAPASTRRASTFAAVPCLACSRSIPPIRQRSRRGRPTPVSTAR
jgi:hypothetical protein